MSRSVPLSRKHEQGCSLLALSKLACLFHSCSHEILNMPFSFRILHGNPLINSHYACREEIKNQMVDSHQSKAWHTANSLKNSSASFPHEYLPCVTLPFLRLLTCHCDLRLSTLFFSHTQTFHSPTETLRNPPHILGLTWSLFCHHNHWWNIIYSAEPYSHRSVIAGRARDGPGFPFAQLPVVHSEMTKTSAPFFMHTVLSNQKEKKGVCILLFLFHLEPLL